MAFKDLNVEIASLDGTAILNDDNKTTTVKEMVITALLANIPNEQNIDGEEKFMRFTLAQKLYNSKSEVDLSPEEIVKIKALVGKVFGALAVGQIYKILNA